MSEREANRRASSSPNNALNCLDSKYTRKRPQGDAFLGWLGNLELPRSRLEPCRGFLPVWRRRQLDSTSESSPTLTPTLCPSPTAQLCSHFANGLFFIFFFSALVAVDAVLAVQRNARRGNEAMPTEKKRRGKKEGSSNRKSAAISVPTWDGAPPPTSSSRSQGIYAPRRRYTVSDVPSYLPTW